MSAYDWMISLVLRPLAYALAGRDAVLLGAAGPSCGAAASALTGPVVRMLRAA